jgi:CHAD domain-containing protein
LDNQVVVGRAPPGDALAGSPLASDGGVGNAVSEAPQGADADDEVTDEEPWHLARTTADVVRLALGTDAARLIAHDPIARLGADPEGVHQARVATRRLRSHLGTFAAVLRAKPSKRLSRQLRDLGRILGTARDLDVMSGRFELEVAEFEPMYRDDGVALLGLLASERAAAHDALRRFLSSKKHRELLGRLGAFVADPPLRGRAGAPPEDALLEVIHRRYDTLDAAIEALPATPPDVLLHEVRIIAKPARYAAEIGAPVLGQACRRLAKRLADLSDDLGSLNDGARANEWLDGAGEDPSMEFAVALVRAQEIERMVEARAEWPRQWQRVRIAAAEMGWIDAPPI